MSVRPSLALATLAAAVSLALATARCGEPTAPGSAERAATITAADIRRWVDRLADDSMRGRNTPGPEIEQAAATIAAYFDQLGLEPAFPGRRFVSRYPAPPSGLGSDSAPNVGAILPGRDALAGQYVVLIAHLDGKGIGRPIGEDSVYNGADDNASGCAAVLELAEAFAGASLHPRRSLLFLLVTGEEEGYWGSQWYVDHPPIPLGDIVGVVNLDMIGRNGADSVLVGGLDLSTLGYQLSDVANAHPDLGFDVIAPAPQGGSDFVPFWVKGIPWLFLFTGLHPDYHTPVDEPDRVDADKAARVARLAFYTALVVADADARPLWLTSAAPPAAERSAPR